MNIKKTLRIALIVVIAALYAFPVLWVILTAFKERVDIFAQPPRLFFSLTLDNFARVFTDITAEGATVPTSFGKYFLNSALLSFGSVFTAIVLGTMGAYAVSRFPFKNRDFAMFAILSTRMLPAVAVVIPVYLLYRTLNLMNTYIGMTMLYTAFNLPFVIWMMRSFFDEVPREVEEAAMMDGSSRFRAFYKVALPQVRSGIAGAAVISLLFTWNEYLFASLLTREETRTVPIALAQTLQGESGVDWGKLAAIETLYILPVLLAAALLQKYLLRGLTFGTVKE